MTENVPAWSPKEQLTTIAREIFAESLARCSIERALISKFSRAADGNPYAFTLRGAPDEPVAKIDLTGVKRIHILSAGKGAAAMMQSLLGRLPISDSCAVSGVLIAPERSQQLPQGIEFFAGAHPLPDRDSFRGAEAALAMVQEAVARNNIDRAFCFFLISGGASAMMELPCDAAISLEDTADFHQVLIRSGASIEEVNCVRKHFSAVKGGRLGLLAATVPNITLLVSDVPAGRLDTVASGPTLPDSTTVAQCLGIIDRYNLLQKFPPSVQAFFRSRNLPETPKPHSFPARALTLLSDADLADAARRSAEARGFTVIVDNTCDDWDYRRAAEYLLGRLRDLRRNLKRVCLISVGELTVMVSRPEDVHPVGLGGRNQHFALYAATLLKEEDGVVAIFSAGSDGMDGNSPFAGAALDRDLLRAEHDLSPNMGDSTDQQHSAAAIEALARFDSATFLHRIGATIRTCATGNNLRDLRLFLAM